MRKPVDFTLGGRSYSVTVEIGHAIEIENALGRGVLSVVPLLSKGEARLIDAANVIRSVLAKDGVRYDVDKVVSLCATEGLIETQVTALRLINALFVTDGAPAKKGKAAAAGPLATATP
jgi:hypothetical protein